MRCHPAPDLEPSLRLGSPRGPVRWRCSQEEPWRLSLSHKHQTAQLTMLGKECLGDPRTLAHNCEEKKRN